MTTIAQSTLGVYTRISASLPATEDAVGFQALSYTTIADITDSGTFGAMADLLTHQPNGTGLMHKLKGGYNPGQQVLKGARHTAANPDAGQTILQAASLSKNDYSFETELADGTKFYYRGKVMGFPVEIGGIAIMQFNSTIEINSPIFEV